MVNRHASDTASSVVATTAGVSGQGEHENGMPADDADRAWPVTTWQGWQHFAPSAPKPPVPGAPERSGEERLAYLSAFVTVRTPASATLTTNVRTLMILGRHQQTTTRPSLIVTGPTAPARPCVRASGTHRRNPPAQPPHHQRRRNRRPARRPHRTPPPRPSSTPASTSPTPLFTGARGAQLAGRTTLITCGPLPAHHGALHPTPSGNDIDGVTHVHIGIQSGRARTRRLRAHQPPVRGSYRGRRRCGLRRAGAIRDGRCLRDGRQDVPWPQATPGQGSRSTPCRARCRPGAGDDGARPLHGARRDERWPPASGD